MKRCSASLANREMQIKITMRYYFTLVRMAIINIPTNNKCWRGYVERGTQTGEATVENSMDFSQKTKNGTAF